MNFEKAQPPADVQVPYRDLDSARAHLDWLRLLVVRGFSVRRRAWWGGRKVDPERVSDRTSLLNHIDQLDEWVKALMEDRSSGG